MKLITAIIQMDKLDEVREALAAIQITRITVSRAAGRGRQADEELHRGQVVIPDLIPKMRIEIACKDEDLEKICGTIAGTARHGQGKIGDGKIFVTELLKCIRIRTRESGAEAI
ncbi:MAG: P-II family nitrogen regulator [Candidatus Omnitrophica bacterium]|nr:P-II family nitrogen regulator [Candidatus Omnitrophota bacterium]